MPQEGFDSAPELRRLLGLENNGKAEAVTQINPPFLDQNTGHVYPMPLTIYDQEDAREKALELLRLLPQAGPLVDAAHRIGALNLLGIAGGQTEQGGYFPPLAMRMALLDAIRERQPIQVTGQPHVEAAAGFDHGVRGVTSDPYLPTIWLNRENPATFLHELGHALNLSSNTLAGRDVESNVAIHRGGGVRNVIEGGTPPPPPNHSTIQDAVLRRSGYDIPNGVPWEIPSNLLELWGSLAQPGYSLNHTPPQTEERYLPEVGRLYPIEQRALQLVHDRLLKEAQRLAGQGQGFIHYALGTPYSP
jgi:hypothetical protein